MAIESINRPHNRLLDEEGGIFQNSDVAPAQDLAVTHATVYASPEARPLSDATVVIRHGVISGVGQHLRTPRGIETIACHGCAVLADFWNAHVHFMESKWNDAAHQPVEKLAHQMSEMLTHSGLTTGVDTGSLLSANTSSVRVPLCQRQMRSVSSMKWASRRRSENPV